MVMHLSDYYPSQEEWHYVDYYVPMGYYGQSYYDAPYCWPSHYEEENLIEEELQIQDEDESLEYEYIWLT